MDFVIKFNFFLLLNVNFFYTIHLIFQNIWPNKSCKLYFRVIGKVMNIQINNRKIQWYHIFITYRLYWKLFEIIHKCQPDWKYSLYIIECTILSTYLTFVINFTVNKLGQVTVYSLLNVETFLLLLPISVDFIRAIVWLYRTSLWWYYSTVHVINRTWYNSSYGNQQRSNQATSYTLLYTSM